MKQMSENRKAFPKFILLMLGCMLLGGLIGLALGLTNVFGLDTGAVARGAEAVICAVAPWGIPVTTALTMSGAFLLYRSAKKKLSGWDGGDESDATERAELLLSWCLLLSAVQFLLNLFFLASVIVLHNVDNTLPIVVMFLFSCGFVIFAQQKIVDLEKQINPEKRGSVYDTRFQEKWMDSCDESERQQIGQACYLAYQRTNKVCMGLWLLLVILGMVFKIGLLPVVILLVVMGTMQISYTLECIRISKSAGH